MVYSQTSSYNMLMGRLVLSAALSGKSLSTHDLGVYTTVQITISTSLCLDDFWYWNKALTLTSSRIPRLRLRRYYSIIVQRLKLLPATLAPIDVLGKSSILSQKDTNTFTIGINNTRHVLKTPYQQSSSLLSCMTVVFLFYSLE